MTYYSDNPYRDADRWLADQEKWLEGRPVCSQCKEHIQEDKAYEINGELWCADCIEDCKVNVEDWED